jgi:hypothetical protein
MLNRQAPLAPDEPANLADWTHSRVGWGVVLAENEALSEDDRARGADAPEPIRELLAERPDAPVLRDRSDLEQQDKLARYFVGGGRQDPAIGMTPFGVEKGRLPLYLLIVGSPEEIPWSLQFSLNRRHHVGRLDLGDDGLANYITALRNGWTGMDSNAARPVVWSVTHDSMTTKMDLTVAEQMHQALVNDPEIDVSHCASDEATCDALVAVLVASKPAVVVTSSHGKTGPLENPDAMRAALGLPIDANRATLDPDKLLETWSPSGVVWYAQACCSAGSNTGTSYAGLLEPDSMADRVTKAIGELGPSVAPLPTKLLSAAHPARAFIGHVEPTFDWTLIDQGTGQFLTAPLVEAIYPSMYRRCPVGISFDAHYRGVGGLYAKLAKARRSVNMLLPGSRDTATYFKLTAVDRESLVLLGDPTVAVPPLPSQVGEPHPPTGCGT